MGIQGIIITIVITAGTLMGGAIWYLHRENNSLAVEVAQRTADVQAYQASYDGFISSYNQLEGEYNDARQQRNTIQQKLAKHDIAKMLASHPSLVVRALNNGTASLFGIIGCASEPSCKEATVDKTGASKP